MSTAFVKPSAESAPSGVEVGRPISSRPASSGNGLAQPQTALGKRRLDSVLSGRLTEMSLTSILQALAANAVSGNVVIRAGEQNASLYIEKGQLVHARLGRLEGLKAFCRMVEMGGGKFHVFTPGRKPGESNMTGNVEGHLLEAARCSDEMAVCRQQLPANDTRLELNPNMVAPISKLTYAILEVLSSVRRYETVGEIMDRCALTDLDIARTLLQLLQRKVIRIRQEA